MNSSIFTLILFVMLIFNPLSHYLFNECGFINTYYSSYIAWTLALFICIIFHQFNIIKKNIIYNYILLVFLMISLFNGERFFNSLSNLHTPIFISIAFLFSLSLHFKTKTDDKQLFLLYNSIIIMGVFASIYALVNQTSMYLLSLQGVDMGLNGWGVVSFFGQRNKFAQYIVFCSIAAFYMLIETKRKLYIIPLLLFVTNIFVTNSRGSLLFVLIAIGIPFLYKIKEKSKAFTITILAIITFIIINNIDFITEMMNHETSSGEDSSSERLFMWEDTISFLVEKNSLLIGFGNNSTETFLYSKYRVGSSHNTFIDILFEGGLIYLFIYAYILYFSYTKIKRNNNFNYKLTHTCALLGYILFSCVETGSKLIACNFFSITATIIFIIIPQYYQSKKI